MNRPSIIVSAFGPSCRGREPWEIDMSCFNRFHTRKAQSFSLVLLVFSLFIAILFYFKRLDGLSGQSINVLDSSTTLSLGEKSIVIKFLQTQDAPLVQLETSIFPYADFTESRNNNYVSTAAYVKKEFRRQGYKFDSVIEDLYARNRVRVTLDIQSDMSGAYFIDHEGLIKKYSGNPKTLRNDNPQFHSWMEISIPVYDEKAGVVLIFRTIYRNLDNADGSVVAYRYEGENLEYIAMVPLYAE